MGGRAWSAEEIATLRSMYEAGEPHKEVASRLGRSVVAVVSALHVHGILRNPFTRLKGRHWTHDELEHARAMYAAGASTTQIATATRRSCISIKRLISERGFVRASAPSIDLAAFNSPTEEWRQSEMTHKTYAVSSLGRVMTLRPGRIGTMLRQWVDDEGYAHVCLTIDGKQKRRAVHVLVADAFHGPKPTPQHQAAHGDGNPQNNAASNIRWATAKENQRDRFEHGTSNWRVDRAALGHAILRVAVGQSVRAAARAESIDEQSLRRVVRLIRGRADEADAAG